MLTALKAVPKPRSADPAGIYAWQQSVIADGDIDPANQLAQVSGDGFPLVKLPHSGQTVRIDKYPVGWSLTMLPFTGAAKLIRLALGISEPVSLPAGYAPPYAYVVWGVITVLGALSFALLYRLLTRFFDPDVSAIASVSAFIGSAALAYFWKEPYLSHAVAAFWLTVAFFATAKYIETARLGWLVLTSAACGMLALTRSLDLLLALPILGWIVCRPPKRGWRLAFDLGVGAVIGIAFVSLQGVVNAHLYGKFFFNAYAANGEAFSGSLRNLLPFLAGKNHGVFLWHPVLVLAVLGLLLLAWKDGRAELRVVAVLSGIAVVLTVLTYTFWWCWWLGDSYGARWTADLLPIWALGIAAWISRTQRSAEKPLYSLIYLVPLVSVTLGTLILQVIGRLPLSY
ncbi:MAG: hypothetical protein QM754_05050 [Tepidisphaeraceae bacterium]